MAVSFENPSHPRPSQPPNQTTHPPRPPQLAKVLSGTDPSAPPLSPAARGEGVKRLVQHLLRKTAAWGEGGVGGWKTLRDVAHVSRGGDESWGGQ